MSAVPSVPPIARDATSLRLSRRRMLGAGAALALVPWVGYRVFARDARNVVVDILERRTNGLLTDPVTFPAFATDYLKAEPGAAAQLGLWAASPTLLSWATTHARALVGNRLPRLEDKVVSRYLLSTDFFYNGAHVDQPVTYVGFFDPHVAPCRNPFLTRG